MFLEKTNSSMAIHEATLFADGVAYLNTGQLLLAYAAFEHLSKNSKDKSVALLYNMALCYHAAEAYPKAVELLLEAKARLKSTFVKPINQTLPTHLWADEYQNNHHRLALNENAVLLNTNMVKLRMLRLLVDINLALENWQEVIRLSALPEMDKCKNVQEALALAKSKT